MAEQKDMSSPYLTETPKVQLTAEQPHKKKKLESTKKDNPTSKDKERSELHIRLPSLGVWKREEDTPESLTLKASRV